MSARSLSATSSWLLNGLFAVYRRTLSPFFAATGLGQCRYLPTCSEYAYVAVARHGWLRGSVLAGRRLSRCHPWSAGGLDPVPPASDRSGTKCGAADHLP